MPPINLYELGFDKVYIKILTYEFENEYVSFRIFSQGKWEIKI